MRGPLRAGRIAAAQIYPACPERFGTGRCISSKKFYIKQHAAGAGQNGAGGFLYLSFSDNKKVFCLMFVVDKANTPCYNNRKG